MEKQRTTKDPEMPSITREGAQKIWHIPQIPMKPFEILVSGPPQAAMLLDMLAQYDLFELSRGRKPDYSNANGLLVFEGGEWVDWESVLGDSFEDWKVENWTRPTVLSDAEKRDCLVILRQYDTFQVTNHVKRDISSKAEFLRLWPTQTFGVLS